MYTFLLCVLNAAIAAIFLFFTFLLLVLVSSVFCLISSIHNENNRCSCYQVMHSQSATTATTGYTAIDTRPGHAISCACLAVNLLDLTMRATIITTAPSASYLQLVSCTCLFGKRMGKGVSIISRLIFQENVRRRRAISVNFIRAHGRKGRLGWRIEQEALITFLLVSLEHTYPSAVRNNNGNAYM